MVRDLRTYFPFGGRWVGRRQWVRAVDGVDLEVERGEVLGLVGESGSGKTSLGRSILRLIEPTRGMVEFDGVEVTALGWRQLRAMRSRMQIVFQDPYKSLSPRMQIGQIIAEPLLLHRLVPRSAVRERVLALLEAVGLEPYFATRYPHEMSGGQRQRIAIARALSLQPEFIVADEPVSALDASVRASILNILLQLQRRAGIALLFISHDLTVVERVANRVAVMYRGRIVEEASARAVVDGPLHPYTQALLSAVPTGDPQRKRERMRLRGEPVSATTELSGCAFAPRCPMAQPLCRQTTPILEPARLAHRVACHLVGG